MRGVTEYHTNILSYKVYMIAASNKFLRIYYARVKEALALRDT